MTTIIQEKTRIAVIYGGKSMEREVSVKSAFSILKAIDYKGKEVYPIHINSNGDWELFEKLTSPPTKLEKLMPRGSANPTSTPIALMILKDIDVAFPVLHGPYGEDGKIQGLFEMLNVPYIGCDVISSALSMDKVTTKIMLDSFNIPQGRYTFITRGERLNSYKSIEEVKDCANYPCFIKPANMGSSIGISKAKNAYELEEAINKAFEYDKRVIIEEFIDGRELEIGVLQKANGEIVLSAIGEVATTSDFYDYEAKYQNKSVTNLSIPADISEDTKALIDEFAKKTYKALQCSGLARIDFFLKRNSGEILVNEVNTMPGFTERSMFPMLFDKVGISYSSLIEQLIKTGMAGNK